MSVQSVLSVRIRHKFIYNALHPKHYGVAVTINSGISNKATRKMLSESLNWESIKRKFVVYSFAAVKAGRKKFNFRSSRAVVSRREKNILRCRQQNGKESETADILCIRTCMYVCINAKLYDFLILLWFSRKGHVQQKKFFRWKSNREPGRAKASPPSGKIPAVSCFLCKYCFNSFFYFYC